MIKRLFSAIVLVFLFTASVNASQWTLNDVLEATCRVHAGNAYGSGTCIYHENGLYYILTNAHVVGNSSTAYLEFFKLGRKTLPLPGNVVYRRLVEQSELDFAIVTVKEEYFGKYPPKIAELAPIGVKPEGNYIKSAGCPSARWPVAWEGTILEQTSGHILFYPPPIGGQSGSGLYILGSKDGKLNTYLKGVVTWRIGTNLESRDDKGYESATGGAVLIDRLLMSLNGEVKYNDISIPDNYIPVAMTETGRKIPSDWTGPFALANDGKYYAIYEDSRGFRADVPHTAVIIKWGVQCPDGVCPIPPRDSPPRLLPIPPRESPTPDPGNPYDNLPDFNNPNPSEPEPPAVVPDLNKDKELRDKIEALQKQVDELQTEKSNLEHDILVLNKQIKDAADRNQAETDALHKEIASLQQLLQQKDNQITQSQIDITTLQKQNGDLSGLQDKLDSANSQVDALSANLQDNQQTTKVLWITTGILGSVGGISIIIWLLRQVPGLVHRYRPLTDPIQDKIDERLKLILPADIVDNLRGTVEAAGDKGEVILQKKIDDLIAILEKKKLTDEDVELAVNIVNKDLLDDRIAIANAHVTEKTDDLSDQIDNLNLSMDERLKNLAEKLQKPDTNAIPVAYNTDGGTAANTSNIEDNKNLVNETAVVSPTTINNNVIVSNVKGDRKQNRRNNTAGMKHFRELLKIKQRDGENPEYYAILGYLYKEAVEQLRKGSLYYKGETKLLGQEKTAQKINDWVTGEFAKRHSSGTYEDVNDLELEAMLGFLYKEAVDKLRNGDFNTLGAEDTANEIVKWINKEYTRRVGVKIS